MKITKLFSLVIVALALTLIVTTLNSGLAHAGIPDCAGEGSRIENPQMFKLSQINGMYVLDVKIGSEYNFDAIDLCPALQNGEDVAQDCTEMENGLWSCHYSEINTDHADIIVADFTRGSGKDRCIVAWVKKDLDEMEIEVGQETDPSKIITEPPMSPEIESEYAPETTLPEDGLPMFDTDNPLRAVDAMQAYANATPKGGGSCSLVANNLGSSAVSHIFLLIILAGLVMRKRK